MSITLAGSKDYIVPHKLRTNELVRAAFEGLVETVGVLLGSGHAFPSDVLGAALFSASENGHGAVVDLLLTAGAPVDACCELQYTSLMLAASGGHAEVVDLLLKKGADVNVCCSEQHYTPLMKAAAGRHLNVIGLLAAAGANMEAVDNMGCSALSVAVLHNEHVGVLRALIRGGAKVNGIGYKGCTPLYLAVENGNLDVVRELLAEGADPDRGRYAYKTQPDGSRVLKHMETPLMYAIRTGMYARILLEEGKANVNAVCDGGWTVLMKCAHSGGIGNMETILEAGADPFAKLDSGPDQPPELRGKTALELAMASGGNKTLQKKKKKLLKEAESKYLNVGRQGTVRAASKALTELHANIPLHPKRRKKV